MYYRNAAAAIVCFDITNVESFSKMQDWVEELNQNVGQNVSRFWMSTVNVTFCRCLRSSCN
jgi:GTPase SAR1 family protein